MDRLPLELFERITSYLTIEEKEQLSLVCRRWYDLIINHSMYTNIRLENDCLQDAMDYFEKNKQRCQQIRSLRLENKDSSSLSFYLTLPQQFTRLQEYEIQHFLRDTDLEVGQDVNLQPWNKITSFHESAKRANPTIMCLGILERGAFVNLTRLQLDFGSTCPLDATTNLVRHLHLAPKLKHLVLESSELTLSDMEVLHERAPLLETLCLSKFAKTIVSLEDLEANSLVVDNAYCKPAPRCLTHLSLHDMRQQVENEENFSVLCRLWMNYLSKKYIHVKHLTIDDFDMRVQQEEEHIPKNALVKLVSSLPLLETYNVNILPIDYKILTSMDLFAIKLKNTIILDCEDNIEHYVVALLSSKQADTLQSLSVRSSMWILHNNGSFRLWHQFGKFSALRHLELVHLNAPSYHKCSSLDLTHFIHGVPQLESFKTARATVKISCDAWGKVRSKANWKSIQLKDVKLDQDIKRCPERTIDLMTYVAHTCPALEHLILQVKSSYELPHVFKVEFPHRYFKRLEVSFENMTFFKVYNENQAVWYEFDRQKTLVKSHFKKPILGDQDYVSVVYEGSTSLKIMGKDIPNW